MEDRELVERLRARDEAAYMELVERYGPSMLRFALTFVRSRAVAEDVVQDAWVGVLRGIDSFEGRSSLKTWLFRIVANTARTRAEREARTVPFAAFGEEAAVEPERFLGPDHPRFPGAWATPPADWPAERLEAQEVRELVDGVIAELPPQQRQVITLRDVLGADAEEVRNALGVSEVNQRVLLHRARSRVRRALERYLDET